MISLLVLEKSSGYGGSTSYLIDFVKYLDRNIFKTFVIFYDYIDEPVLRRIKDLGIDARSISKNKKKKPKSRVIFFQNTKVFGYFVFFFELFFIRIREIIKIGRFIKKNKIELVLLNSEVHFHFSGVLAAFFTGTPCVVRKSGVGTDKSTILRSFLSRFAFCFISSSNAETRFHKEQNWPYREIITIYEGVDTDYFYPLPKNFKIHNELNIPRDSIIIGYISRIDEGKGLEDLINAARLVIQDNRNVFFIVIGDDVDSMNPALKKSYLQLLKDLKIEDNLFFLGWRTDINNILQNIDVFVHCPNAWREGMSVATLEAIASGKPVIVTDNWGLAETTIDGYNGFLVPTGDHVQLAKMISLLAFDKDMATRMGLNSRKRAESEFDLSKNIKRIERILISAVNQRN